MKVSLRDGLEYCSNPHTAAFVILRSAVSKPSLVSHETVRTPQLLTPISSLYFKFVRGADTAISNFSFLISHSRKMLLTNRTDCAIIAV